MKQKWVVAIFLLIVLVFNFGCESTNGLDPNAPGYLFKATFSNNWLTDASGQAVIFLSDNNGNILSEKTWSGNDSFEMFIDESLDESVKNNISEINVTTVTRNASNGRVSIYTYMGIDVGSSWNFRSYAAVDYNNPQYSVQLDFENVPAYEGYYIVSTKWNEIIISGSQLGTPFNFSFHESPTDIYVKLNTVDSGVKYLWLNNVISGSRQDDLSNMNTCSFQTISLPSNYGYRKDFSGLTNPGHRYDGRYLIDYGRDYNPTNSINVYYPPGSFTEYRTSITLIEDLYTKEYYQVTYGDIPNQFTKLNADFTFINNSVDNFIISAYGDYLESLSLWRSDGYNNQWSLYSAKDVTSYKLPYLPNSVTQIFNVNRSEFELWLVDLIDYPELSSYSEILETVFISTDYFYDVVNELRRVTKYSPSASEILRNNRADKESKSFESKFRF